MKTPDKPIVLIVDDVPSNIQSLASCLKSDFRVKVATSGDHCLSIAHGDEPLDLILLDIQMPGMNGYETLEALKNNYKTAAIPVIFVTGKDENDDEELGLNLGAVDYITKPFQPAIVLARAHTHILLKKQRDQLSTMATRDSLTGLYNRHYLLESAYQVMARAMRHQQPVSLMILDIDHFKRINDTLGHAHGDVVIKGLATCLKEYFRDEDTVVRFGGEEFLILLDQCPLDQAVLKAETIRQRVETLNIIEWPITISVGVAELDFHEGFESLLKRADHALYEAKAANRNCVVFANPFKQDDASDSLNG